METKLTDKILSIAPQMLQFLNYFTSSFFYFQDVGCQTDSKEKRRYTDEEIANATVMYYGGKSTYKFMRKNDIVKLPAEQTVRDRTKHFRAEPGFQDEILKLLSKYG